MFDDLELLSELEEFEKSSSLLISKPSLLILLRNFLPVANFIQFLSFFCTFPQIIPLFPNLTPFRIDPNNLDLTRYNLKDSDGIKLINQLNVVSPNITKVSILTRRFHSGLSFIINDILRTFANYKNLEFFDVQFDSVDKKIYLNVPFENLKTIIIRINYRKIKNINKTTYLVNNILRFTRKLSEAKLYNALINNQISISLSYNVNLKTIEIINCTLEKGPKRNFKMLFNIPSLEKLIVLEIKNENNFHITEILFEQISHSKTLKHIKYENIRLCTSLEFVTLTYFDQITPSFIQIFKNLIEILCTLYNRNPFVLSIDNVISKHEFRTDSTYDDFERYIENLDGFGPILYTDHY